MTLDPLLSWSSYPLVVLDFETTGIDALTCAPVSVAAVRYEGGVEVGHFYSLVNEGVEIPASASAIHGITAEHLKDAPPLAELAADLFTLAEGAVPCAYNATYDRTILHRHIAGADCPAFNPAQDWICPLVIVRDVDKYVGGKGRHTLTTTCARWGVPLDAAHNALADARATGRLLHTLVVAGKLTAGFPLGKLLSHIAARRLVHEADFAAYRARVEAGPAPEQLELK